MMFSCRVSVKEEKKITGETSNVCEVYYMQMWQEICNIQRHIICTYKYAKRTKDH
jgi:hypothetical protein